MTRIYFDPTFLGKIGGIGTDSRYFLESIQALGFSVNTEPIGDHLEKFSARILSKIGLQKFIKFLPSRLTAIELNEFDIYIATQVSSPPPSKSFKGEWYVRVHDLFPLTNPKWFHLWSTFGFRKGIKNLIALKPTLIFNSNSTLAAFKKKFPHYDENLMKVLPCRIPKFQNSTPCNECAGCSFDIRDRVYLIAIGTIEPRKNYPQLIKSFIESELPIDLLILGNYGWKSRKVSRFLKNSEKVIWIRGACSFGLARVLKDAYAFVSNSLDEGFNLPVYEARGFQIPLLLSDISAHHEFHEGEALIFESTNLSKVLSLLISNPPVKPSLPLIQESNLASILGFKLP